MTSNLTRIPQIMPWIEDEERAFVDGVLEDNWLTEGARSREFAVRLLELIGAPYGVFAPNGTLALALALMALEIQPGDEVILPDSTFVGSASAVLLAGGTPVFVDIDARTLQIDVSKAERAVTAKTAAIMPVHLMGTSADMDGVMALAKRHDLKVIEDAAQGIGVSYKGRHVGSIGDIGCFSFFADKTITTGEGGFITCRTPELHERLLFLRNQGRLNSGSFIHPMVGFNFRITDMQAAVGLAQLNKLDSIIDRKLSNLELYRERLAGNPHVRILESAPDSTYVPFRAMLTCDSAFELAEHLGQSCVDTRRFFYPMHRQPCFTDIFGFFDDATYPNAIETYEHGLLLPIFPTMTAEDIVRITDAIDAFYE